MAAGGQNLSSIGRTVGTMRSTSAASAKTPTADADPADDIEIAPITCDRLADLDALLSKGDPRTCQCAWMRLTNAEFAPLSADERRSLHHAAIRAAEAEGRAAGLLAYREGSAVGWVSFGWRDEFERVSASPARQAADDVPAWSVVCFVVSARARRHGVASRLLDAAVDYAREHGAPAVEGYPTATGRRSNDLWRGTVGMFDRAGFTPIAVRTRLGSPDRPVMRLGLDAHDSTKRGSSR